MDKKNTKEEKIVIKLSEGEVLTDLYDNGGDATELDDAETITEIKVKYEE